MSIFIFATYISVHFVTGARPSRDFTDFGRHLELEHNDTLRPVLTKGSATAITGPRDECVTLQLKLGFVGLRGEGNPCSWDGIGCSSECRITSLITDDKVNFHELQILSAFRHLETLKLSNASQSGTLVQRLRSLRRLDLSGTQVEGWVGKLAALDFLKVVDLSDTKVNGFWASLRILPLHTLRLGNTEVAGNLKYLRKFKELKHLDLSGTRLGGDIATLEHLKGLELLNLSNTEVKGSITSLKSLPMLRIADLSNTQVVGDLNEIELQLRNTEVKGNKSTFEDLAPFPRLEWLNLGNTMVNGSLHSLQNCRALRGLCLHNTDVDGDLSSLQNLTSMQELRLSNTKVVGNLGFLQNLTQLQLLQLESAPVVGNLSSLYRLQGLRVLRLSNTKVTGELKDLQHFKKLEVAHLDDVELEGNLAYLEQLRSLRHLSMMKCKASGDIAVFQNFSGLEYLDLSYSQVSGDVKAFQHLTGLRSIYLTATEVRGSLEAFGKLTRLERLALRWAQIDGDVGTLESVRKLRVLGLSDTNVTGDIKSLQSMTNLYNLFLTNTNVYGDVNDLFYLTALQIALLDNTGVSGWIEPDVWIHDGEGRRLMELNLADTSVGPLEQAHGIPKFSTASPLLPALSSLNVSGCQLNGPIADLLLPFAASGISRISASGCNLTGEVPNIAEMKAKVDDFEFTAWRSTLSRSLKILDLSSNYLISAPAAIASWRMDLRQNKVPLRISSCMIKQVLHQKTELWLEETTLANPEELQTLISHELPLKAEYAGDGSSFFCRSFENPLLLVTPELFLPQNMCACRPGYIGSAITCSACPANSYSSEPNSKECSPCPRNSSTREASSSCTCDIGTITKTLDGTLRCECKIGEAFVAQPGHERCESCQKLKLTCSKPGSNASTAPVQNGYARLQMPSDKVYQCLNPARCLSSGCVKGYRGRLCSECAPRHRESGQGRCKQCSEVENISAATVVLLGLCGAGAVALLGAAAWAIRRRLDFGSDLRWKCVAQLLLPQLGALLQFVQLWVVLARLAKSLEDVIDPSVASATTNSTGLDLQSDGWTSYLEVLQLSATELQGLLSLQCVFNGTMVRSMFAIATPLLPLALLLMCSLVEFFATGVGIRVGLQLLTVLFIGGKVSLGDFAFRRLMPHLLCSEATWVNHIGKACAFCYGVVIPSFLAFLFAKQHLVMRQTQTFVAQYQNAPQKVTLRLQMIDNEECTKDDQMEKRLVAAAAVHVAVHVKGQAKVTLAKGANTVTVEQIQTADEQTNLRLSVEFLVPQAEKAGILRKQGKIIRHKTLVQMLTEQSILADIEQNRSDRIMLGAKQIFRKYASCQFVWMEICLKLASAALVSVVGSKDGLGLSVAITMGMALTIAVAQPFARPQQNALYGFCFACLALAAVGFHQLRSWLSQLALLLPVSLLVISLARPDSQEALAMRLHEELEANLHKGPVKVVTARGQFL